MEEETMTSVELAQEILLALISEQDVTVQIGQRTIKVIGISNTEADLRFDPRWKLQVKYTETFSPPVHSVEAKVVYWAAAKDFLATV